MKNRLIALLALITMVTLPGCATMQTNPDRTAALTGAMLELAGTAFAPVLANNPEYRPVAVAVAEALGGLETGTITADAIRAFVGTLAERRNFTAEQRAYAELVAAAAWNIYVAQTGQTVAQLGDVNTKAWIAAFRRGLLTAISLPTALPAKDHATP